MYGKGSNFQRKKKKTTSTPYRRLVFAVSLPCMSHQEITDLSLCDIKITLPRKTLRFPAPGKYEDLLQKINTKGSLPLNSFILEAEDDENHWILIDSHKGYIYTPFFSQKDPTRENGRIICMRTTLINTPKTKYSKPGSESPNKVRQSVPGSHTSHASQISHLKHSTPPPRPQPGQPHFTTHSANTQSLQELPPNLRFNIKQKKRKTGKKAMAVFTEHITIADNTQISPGAPFIKTWRFENQSDRPWPVGSVLALIGEYNDQMGCPASVAVLNVDLPSPGFYVDVAVPFVAPKLPGEYLSFWRPMFPDGERFGDRVRVKIYVVE